MMKVAWHIEMKPGTTETTRLSTTEVRDDQEEIPCPGKPRPETGEFSSRVGHMLEAMPEADCVEALRALEIVQTLPHVETLSTCCEHGFAALDAGSRPSGSGHRAQETAITTAHIEKSLRSLRKATDELETTPTAIVGGNPVSAAVIVTSVVGTQIIGDRLGHSVPTTIAAEDVESLSRLGIGSGWQVRGQGTAAGCAVGIPHGEDSRRRPWSLKYPGRDHPNRARRNSRDERKTPRPYFTLRRKLMEDESVA